jgi:hypothetical protein
METRRVRLESAFKTLPQPRGAREAIKLRGLRALGSSDQAEAQTLLGELAAYGLFIVPSGELESWLSHLNLGGGKPEWLVRLFSRIGQSPDDPNYLHPGNDDVWEFLDRIGDWMGDPKRLGVGV